MRVNGGSDWQARVMGGDFVGDTGVCTSISATSLSDTGKAWVTNTLAGHMVADGSVYGVILSNTATVLTIDKWYVPASPGGVAGATPGNGSTYQILPGTAPASYMAFTQNATAPAVTDAVLTAEINVAGGGFNRSQGLYAHTASTNIYTLSKTNTLTSNDAQPTTPNKVGVFYSAVPVTGPLVFEDLVPNPPPLLTGDSIVTTISVNMG